MIWLPSWLIQIQVPGKDRFTIPRSKGYLLLFVWHFTSHYFLHLTLIQIPFLLPIHSILHEWKSKVKPTKWTWLSCVRVERRILLVTPPLEITFMYIIICQLASHPSSKVCVCLFVCFTYVFPWRSVPSVYWLLSTNKAHGFYKFLRKWVSSNTCACKCAHTHAQSERERE